MENGNHEVPTHNPPRFGQDGDSSTGSRARVFQIPTVPDGSMTSRTYVPSVGN